MQPSTIMIVEDDDSLRQAIEDTLTIEGYQTITCQSAQAGLEKLASIQPDLIISDVQMDGMSGIELLKVIKKNKGYIPIILITAYGNVADAVKAMQLGANDYLAKPFEPNVLLEKVGKHLPAKINAKQPVAVDPKSKQLLSLAQKVAKSDATVLISGESGTGKEVLANFIHDHSDRYQKQFVAINCAAIPESILEATLFGYEKGAFTGAYKATAGKFEQAQGGTLLLDEISEMDLALQAKLLRVIQEKQVERIGGNKVINLDVRIIATTNRDLKQEVSDGKFREDLYYRLNVFPLHWIPIRDRKADILPMVNYLLTRHSGQQNINTPTLSESAKQALLNYSWPGNAREMDNIIQRALIMKSGEQIDLEDLHIPYEKEKPKVEKTKNTLKAQEFDLIKELLDNYQGCRKSVAKELGISERSLRYKIAKMREKGITVQ